MSDMKRIHIAHVVYEFSAGGLENGIVNLINHLPESEYQHSIVCITGHDELFAQRIKTQNVCIYDIKKPAGRSPMWLFTCWKLFRQIKPDICHSRNLNPLEAQLPAFIAGVKCRIHGEHGWDINDLGGTNTKYQKLRRLIKPFVHRYIALSTEAKCYLLDKIGVKEQKITQICNGVDVDRFAPKTRELELPKGFEAKDTVVFGTVGRLAHVKNQEYLLRSFLSLWKDSENDKARLKLLIVGDGELMPHLKSMIKEVGAQDAVWLTGLRDDIPALMNVMDVFVLPSLAEGISNTLLEAMACGLPCIATKVGGNADLIYTPHHPSHLVDVNNDAQLITAMKRYLSNHALLLDEKRVIRRYCVENFSIESMVAHYDATYKTLINDQLL